MKIFWICGHHTVSEAIKNPKRKVVQVICKENSPIEKLCNAHNVKYQYYKHNDENKINLDGNAEDVSSCITIT